MSRRRDPDENDGQPEAARYRSEHDRHDRQSADEHRGLSRFVDRPTATHQCTRDISAADAADVSKNVDNGQRQAKVFKVEAVLFVEKIREPKKVNPPYRISQKLTDRERPRLTVREEASPGNCRRRFLRVALDVFEFTLRKTFIFLGTFVDR